jgi:hypothetical protein
MEIHILGIGIALFATTQGLPEGEGSWSERTAEGPGSQKADHEEQITEVRLAHSVRANKYVERPDVEFGIFEVLEILNSDAFYHYTRPSFQTVLLSTIGPHVCLLLPTYSAGRVSLGMQLHEAAKPLLSSELRPLHAPAQNTEGFLPADS